VRRRFRTGGTRQERWQHPWTKPVPTAEEISTVVLKGQRHGDHMRNFVECIKTRKQPISDRITSRMKH
jgi:hypothetical protein